MVQPYCSCHRSPCRIHGALEQGAACYRLYVKCLMGCFSYEFESHILMRVICIQLPHVLLVYSITQDCPTISCIQLPFNDQSLGILLKVASPFISRSGVGSWHQTKLELTVTSPQKSKNVLSITPVLLLSCTCTKHVLYCISRLLMARLQAGSRYARSVNCNERSL